MRNEESSSFIQRQLENAKNFSTSSNYCLIKRKNAELETTHTHFSLWKLAQLIIMPSLSEENLLKHKGEYSPKFSFIFTSFSSQLGISSSFSQKDFVFNVTRCGRAFHHYIYKVHYYRCVVDS
ncbi:uncharacterized protein [Prorops nasuta]|uniref:uncharacterized protein isoform X2 n=1 Tax=Prorops nasuta TaxID=863751 RepID=UPI0034CE327B